MICTDAAYAGRFIAAVNWFKTATEVQCLTQRGFLNLNCIINFITGTFFVNKCTKQKCTNLNTIQWNANCNLSTTYTQTVLIINILLHWIKLCSTEAVTKFNRVIKRIIYSI